METYSKKEFEEIGLNMEFVQDNRSKPKKGIFRGLHFQTQNSQGKLVRVTAGSVLDIAVDLRCDGKIFGKYIYDYNIDFLVDFAAESHVDRSIENPGVFLETNILGTQTLMDVAKSHWANGKDENGYPTYKEGKKFFKYQLMKFMGCFQENFQMEKN